MEWGVVPGRCTQQRPSTKRPHLDSVPPCARLLSGHCRRQVDIFMLCPFVCANCFLPPRAEAAPEGEGTRLLPLVPAGTTGTGSISTARGLTVGQTLLGAACSLCSTVSVCPPKAPPARHRKLDSSPTVRPLCASQQSGGRGSSKSGPQSTRTRTTRASRNVSPRVPPQTY